MPCSEFSLSLLLVCTVQEACRKGKQGGRAQPPLPPPGGLLADPWRGLGAELRAVGLTWKRTTKPGLVLLTSASCVREAGPSLRTSIMKFAYRMSSEGWLGKVARPAWVETRGLRVQR
jgi:hypothetical protein